MKPKALLAFSGGLDSTVALFIMTKLWNWDVKAVGFNYGQKNIIELERARQIATLAGSEFEVIDIPTAIFGSSSTMLVTGGEIINYEIVDPAYDTRIDFIVPARNLLFLVILGIRAEVEGIPVIAYGAITQDHGYPDCTPEFVTATEKALTAAIGQQHAAIMAPVIYYTKEELVALAKTIPGCMDALELSYTCYVGGAEECGHCEACTCKQEAFGKKKG